MLSLFLTLLISNPLLAEAHRHGKRRQCSKAPASTTTVTKYVTMSQPGPVVPSVSSEEPSASSEVLPTGVSSSSSIVVVVPSSSAAPPTQYPTLTVTEGPTDDSTSEGPTETPSTFTTSTAEEPSPTPTTAPTSTAEEPTTTPTTAPTSTDAGLYAEATEVAFRVGSTEQCGDSDILSLPGMPWVVANSMYNSEDMVGSQCTNFGNILQALDETELVSWTSITNIEKVDDTEDLCKGYSNIGIGVNLKQQLSTVSSIPAYFQWDRTNTTEFKGANVFDFITSPTKGDGDSTASSEFMLFLQIWGGQVPIGYAEGPVATPTMYGTSWKLYEGTNPFNQVTVRSMLPDNEFQGEFQGDLKEWLGFMVTQGYISDSEYLNVGNAGSEVFYGSAQMDAKVALDINV